MAPLAYATRGGVKRKLGITDTADDDILDDIIADVNLDIEDMTGRAIGPGTVSGELIDGYDALENGACLPYPKGIRSISSLEVAATTGDTFYEIPSSDFFIRPSSYQRQPDWPGFEIWLTDIPSTGNSLGVFLPGFENIRLSAAIGWVSIPSTIVSAAETTAARTFHARQGGYVEGSDEVGERDFRTLWRGNDIRTVRRYARKGVEII